MKRRDILKGLALLPLAGAGSASALLAAPLINKGINIPGGGSLEMGPQIYQSIGVEPVINCRGTFTIIGASVELPEVRQAMEFACQYFVQLDELAMGVGKRLAELTGAEWGMVSAGCAAGIKHVTAGAVSGGNPEKLIRIPNLEGFEKTEVVIPRSSRSVYDHAIRNIGVKVIMIDTVEELKNAINPRTAMIYYSAGARGITLEEIAAAAKPMNVPILVDAAAEILTIPNVHLAKGATVVAYSGGKAIRGPQCAGLLLGDKNLLMSAWQASSPHHGPGRDNKLGREEHIGMLAAVEAWTKRDHEKEMKTWNGYLDTIAKKVSGVDGVKTTIRQPTGLGNRTPTLSISWDPSKLNITGQEAADELSSTKPRIALSAGGGGGGRGGQAPDPAMANMTSINIAAWMMQPGNDKIVADRVFDVLSRKRAAKPKDMKAPGGTITGRWNVIVDFFTSKSEHQFIIEKQDGNWVQGTHKGDFIVRELAGTIEGNDLKFRSSYNVPGDSINMIFSGTLSGDTMSGTIHMGEYLTSKFTAKRYGYPEQHMPITVPNGPPLSS